MELLAIYLRDHRYVDVAALRARAESQRERLDDLRVRAAAIAFGPAG